MHIHHENPFETEICAALRADGWIHEPGASGYDKALALCPDDLASWVQASQPLAWQELLARYGSAAAVAQILAKGTRKAIQVDGNTIDVIRSGIDVAGSKQRIQLAQFKPAISGNAVLDKRYQENRLRVIRQLRYSQENGNSLDLVLVLNGIPVATAELKSDFTQSIQDAVEQYMLDRNPAPTGKPQEPLLTFATGALVHFAVSNSEVHMTTRLAGRDTVFLPFNKGDAGGAGNPVNPNGHRTSYLWEEIWQRDSWLDIVGRTIVARRDSKRRVEAVVFPRYHQLDATRKLFLAVRTEGAGGKYLIQHSAGSGKTESIAWTAHGFAQLHGSDGKKIFDAVIVVSDRTVIDDQLQKRILGFERTKGVVAIIGGGSQAKSAELTAALNGGSQIIVCTMQTFPFALKEVRRLAAAEDKKFAVIADEAHSSQSGKVAADLREVLTPQEVRDAEDGGAIGIEDQLLVDAKSRADAGHITFVAYTATPKAKTIELFGRTPRPNEDPGPDNIPVAFHVYSMRQAIEEGFILDVLRNWVSYKTAFRISGEGYEQDSSEVEKGRAKKGIIDWVRLHPYNISQKCGIVVEHFVSKVAKLLGGQGKAMVVLSSRLEAIRWKKAIDEYIASKGHRIGTLVAFSGVLDDPQIGDGLTERSAALNPTLGGRKIQDAFATDEFQILLVANKFQTGFDQPLLCGMYVDKRLDGIQAVQTLSRLNRVHPKISKDAVFILDFVNDPEDILSAFRTYYETAEIEAVTDTDIVFNLKTMLDGARHYDAAEVDRVVKVVMDPNARPAELEAAIAPVADRLLRTHKAARKAMREAAANGDAAGEQRKRDEVGEIELFKRNAESFLKAYVFLSQIFDYENSNVEKLWIFLRHLVPLLQFERERDGIDLSKLRLSHHHLHGKGERSLALTGAGDKLKPMTEIGGGELRDAEKLRLFEIITRLNEIFKGEGLTDGDMLNYATGAIKGKLLESNKLVEQAANNTKEQFGSSPDLKRILLDAIMGAMDAHMNMSKQALDSDDVQKGLLRILLDHDGLYEALRDRAQYQTEGTAPLSIGTMAR